MSAIILGFYGTRVPLPWHVRWPMVIGAFTNPGLFLLQALYPALDTATTAQDFPLYSLVAGTSLLLTTYGFGAGAICLYRSTLKR